MYNKLNPYYVSGFSDGEGSFCVSFSPRKLGEVDWEVRPSFSISQHKRSRDVLFKIKDFFACGSIRFSKKDQNYKYEVRSMTELSEKIIPHFQKFFLETSKRKDFLLFQEIIDLMRNNKHLRKDGLKEIINLAKQMNPAGKRNYKF